MELKKLLGEEYNSEMSFSELEDKINDLNLVSSNELKGKIDKAQFDKATSEIAKLKKELKENKTDKDDAFKEMKEELDQLKKEKSISEQKSNFLALGYDEQEAHGAAQALVNNDFPTLFKHMTKFQKLKKQEYEKANLEQMSRPTEGRLNENHTDKKISEMSLSELQEFASKDREAFNMMKGEIYG